MRGGCAAPFVNAVTELDDATAESLLVDKLKIDACVDLQCGVAPPEVVSHRAANASGPPGPIVDEPTYEERVKVTCTVPLSAVSVRT